MDKVVYTTELVVYTYYVVFTADEVLFDFWNKSKGTSSVSESGTSLLSNNII